MNIPARRNLLWRGAIQCIHCPKSDPNFRDLTRNVEENEILHEIFPVVSRFPCYISCYISKNRLPQRQCRGLSLGWKFNFVLKGMQSHTLLKAHRGFNCIEKNHVTNPEKSTPTGIFKIPCRNKGEGDDDTLSKSQFHCVNYFQI